jgi:hypothetical protein
MLQHEALVVEVLHRTYKTFGTGQLKDPRRRFCGQLQADHQNPLLALVNVLTVDYEVLDSGYRLSRVPLLAL